MKRFVRISLLILLVVGTYGLGRQWTVIRRPPVVLHQDAVVSEGLPQSRWVAEDGGFILHEAENAHTLLIFYPGGLVPPQAYQWWAVGLAAQGVTTAIPRFPFDLAVTAPKRAQVLLDRLNAAADKRVIMAGHSLGGSMAARFSKDHPDLVDGLILMGAYSARSDDLSALSLATLVIAAEHDGLATLAEVEAGLSRLPEDSTLTIIDGAVHSFFGRYGPQAGDGLPTVTRAQAETEMLRQVQSFIESFNVFIAEQP